MKRANRNLRGIAVALTSILLVRPVQATTPAAVDAPAGAPPAETAEEAAAKVETQQTRSTLAAALGTDAKSDYVAKNFSLIFGGVILNQFKITSTGTGNDQKFTLDSGSTDAKAFIEAGFRRRWAWLDRDSLLESTMKNDESLAAKRADVSKAVAKRQAAQQGVKAAAAGGNAAEIARSEVELATARTAEITARQELSVAAAPKVKSATEKQDSATAAHYFSLASRCKTDGWFTLLPDDWTVRMGFVFDSSTSSKDVVTTVGASDVYSELGFGWNLVRWSFPTASQSDAPIRGSINLEADGLFYTDDRINDVHGRGILGPAFVFGIPVDYANSNSANPDDPATVRNQSVIELVARGGAVMTEIPEFADDKTTLQTKHGQVDYGIEYGGGFDVELNVPITERLGYLVARSQINLGFNPNPWFISIGYTIPLSTLVSGITSPASGS